MDAEHHGVARRRATFRLLPLALCLLTGLNITASAQAPETPIREAPMAPALQAALEEWAATPGHYGVSASVILADGARWDGAAGPAGAEEAMTPSHRMHVASITKTVTGAIVLTLVDEGVIRLDDPISRWLEDRPNVPAGITVRQLLDHTNGLANYVDSPALQRDIAIDPTRVFTAAELLTYVGPPVAEPGATTRYTNTSFLLLGLIAESATGRMLVDLFQQRLWSPLNLRETFLPGFDEPQEPVAVSFASNGVLVAPMTRISQLTTGNYAAGLVSTARDIASWGHALFAGPLLSESMQMAMRELVPAAGNIPGESGAGLGIRGYTFFDRVQYGHSGGSGFSSSLLLYDPDSGVTVSVIMNQGVGAHHFQLAPRLLAIAAP